MTILFVGFLLVLYGVMAQRKYSVWVGMFFVLLVLGFQEGIPGDYEAYKVSFEAGGEEGGIRGNSIKETEFSIIWLSQTMSRLMNFHWYVLLTSIVQIVIIGLMIKNHVERKYQYFGILLVFFTFNIMMVQMKAMRQGYAVEMILFAYYLLGKRKYLLSLLSVIIGYGFHNSSLFAIPFYLIVLILLVNEKNHVKKDVTFQKSKNKKGVTIPIIASIFFLAFYFLNYWVLNAYVSPYLLTLEFFEYGSFLENISNRSSVSLFILIYYMISVYIVTLYIMGENKLYYKCLAILVIVSFFLFIALSGYGSLQRIVMYFDIFSIVIFPRVAFMLKNNYGRHLAAGYVIFNMLFHMRTSVASMLSNDYINGNGFASFTFSFLNW